MGLKKQNMREVQPQMRLPEHSSSPFQKLITPELVPLGSQGTFVLNYFLAIFFLLFEFV